MGEHLTYCKESLSCASSLPLFIILCPGFVSCVIKSSTLHLLLIWSSSSSCSPPSHWQLRTPLIQNPTETRWHQVLHNKLENICIKKAKRNNSVFLCPLCPDLGLCWYRLHNSVHHWDCAEGRLNKHLVFLDWNYKGNIVKITIPMSQTWI